MEAYFQVQRVRILFEVYFTYFNVRLLAQHQTEDAENNPNLLERTRCGYEEMLMSQRRVRVLCVTKRNEHMWRPFHTNSA